MSLAPYRGVLASSQARTIMALGILLRIPIFSAAVILTLHVVQTLGRSYADAGLVAAIATLGIAISGPWRGRLLDRHGLRRVVLPSLVVALAVWSVAPFVSYWPLLVLSGIAGLFVVPTFSIVRQGVIAAVPESQRRTALALDGIAVELAFMIGPLAAVWLAQIFPTTYVLLGLQLLGVAAGVLLWWVDPALRSDEEVVAGAQGTSVELMTLPRSSWMRGRYLAVCATALGATFVLAGSDVSIVAAMEGFGSTSTLGVVLLIWGLGSAVGGLVYGGMSRSVSPFLLLFLLAVGTAAMAVAPNLLTFVLASLVAGLFVSPTITATVDAVAKVVPAPARGEAMGWHGSFMTGGSALGAPVAGVAIDAAGHGAGFGLVAALGALLATAAAALVLLRRRRRLSTRDVSLAA